MKIFLYFILIVAFLMFYRENPAYIIIIIIFGLIIFLYFRSKKNHNGNIDRRFLTGKNSLNNNRIDDFISMIMLGQIINSSVPQLNNKNDIIKDDKEQYREHYIEKIKKEILELLED
ncbi:MAG: hypothetical protein ACTSQJ_19585 [Promethearchaeota archaeon]